VNQNNIPEELKKLRQWVCWNMVETGNGKKTKVPYNPTKPESKASSNDPNTWGTFREAIMEFNFGKFSGIGFVFTEGDPYSGIDLDKCREDGRINRFALEIVSRFNSYAEVSPSGNGVHIIIRGKIDKAIAEQGFEVYSKERYFTVTGDCEDLTGEPYPILDGQEQLKLLLSEMGKNKGVAIKKDFLGSILEMEAPEGTRFQRSAQIAGYLVSNIEEKLWDIVALPFFLNWCDKKCTPSLLREDPQEVRKTWRNIVERHRESLLKKQDIPEPHKPRDMALSIIEDRKNEVGAPKTGFPELDRIVTGFLPGHVYVMTGNTNVGKTSIACNFVERIRRQSKRCLYFALEPDLGVLEYLASCRLNKMFGQVSDNDLFYDDDLIHVYTKTECPNLDTLVRIIEKTQGLYSAIIIDHVGYFIQQEKNKIEEQENAMKKFAQLSKKNKVAILIIAHINKSGSIKSAKGGLTMDDIAGSASFKQDATEVFLIDRGMNDKGEQLNTGTLTVAKTKKGKNGRIDLIFNEKSAYVVSGEEVDMIAIYNRNKPQQKVEEMTKEEVMSLF